MHIERIGPAERSPLAIEHMVAMRDGIRLATDVYLPDGDAAPGPTVLTRLPYDKNGEYTFMPRVAEYFMRHGYRVVVQDVRGKFRSEGEPLLFVNEADDGHDTLDWIVQQQWSDGVIGMWGDSYYGFTQWAAASTRHPALRAMVPRVTGTRLGELADRIAGTHAREVEMAVHRMYPLTMFHDHDMVLWDMDWTALPYHDRVERFFDEVGSRSASYDLWFPHPVRLNRFRHGSPFDAPGVPVLMTIGWWDNCAPWQWADHAELQRRPHWAVQEYLRVEAIDHENFSHFERPWLRDELERSDDELENMLPRYLDPAVEFFDVFLRGVGSADDIPKVSWELANADRVPRRSATWPPAGTVTVTMHAVDGTAALGRVPGGRLTSQGEMAADTEPVSWKHDPLDPVPSPVPDAFALLAHYADERLTGDRADVLTFTGAVTSEPLDLVGPVCVQLTLRSDGPETDVFARLLDVAADGEARLIARGQLTLLEAGYDAEVAIDLGQVGYRLAAGHSLRLTIASSDAPEYVPHWGSGGNRWAQSTTSVTTQTVLVGPDHGPRLTISMLPGDER